MPNRTEVKPGSPAWIDLSTHHLEESIDFYTQLLGWKAEPVRPGDGGGYNYFTVNGKRVAGIIPSIGTPNWHVYLSVDDINKTAKDVVEHGGQVVVEPTEIEDAGTMAFFVEPGGSEVGAWQSAGHKGSELIDEPGATCWFDLLTSEIDPEFFESVFGWEIKKVAIPEELDAFFIDGEMQGTIIDRSTLRSFADNPSAAPPWYVCLAVENCEASTAAVEKLGGKIIAGPITDSSAFFSIVADPDGAVFCIVEKVEPNWSKTTSNPPLAG
jgi:predicted enzyme related to lactoylglutathione lyase